MGYPTYPAANAASQMPNQGETPWTRTGWWTNNNELGDVRRINMPNNAGEVIPVASCDKMGGPLPYSVTLNRVFNFPPRFNDAGANCDIRARIQFGSGGSSRTIICDWNPGTQLDFAGASFVRVDAVPYAPDPDAPYSVAVEQADASVLSAFVNVGVSIGMTGGPHPRPRFTQRLPVINSGGGLSDIITPPDWAHAVQLVGGSTEGGSIFVATVVGSWIAPDGTPFAQVDGTQMSPTQFLPIPAGSRLQVTNGTASNQRITLVWELAL